MRLLGSNDKPQIDRDAGTVNAVMQDDSVYALTVVSGTRYAGWEKSYPAAAPAKLTIEPGPPFFDRVDGGPIKQNWHAGARLRPIRRGPWRGRSAYRGRGQGRRHVQGQEREVRDRPRWDGTAGALALNLDPDEQGSGVLACPYVGEAVLRMNGGMWSLWYEGENGHHLEGPKFVCGRRWWRRARLGHVHDQPIHTHL